MIFEQVEFSIDNACNLRDLVLKKLVKITVAMYKVVQIWPGHMQLVYTEISSGHIWTTLYMYMNFNPKSFTVYNKPQLF